MVSTIVGGDPPAERRAGPEAGPIDPSALTGGIGRNGRTGAPVCTGRTWRGERDLRTGRDVPDAGVGRDEIRVTRWPSSTERVRVCAMNSGEFHGAVVESAGGFTALPLSTRAEPRRHGHRHQCGVPDRPESAPGSCREAQPHHG